MVQNVIAVEVIKTSGRPAGFLNRAASERRGRVFVERP
jgi:hypothetical protein